MKGFEMHTINQSAMFETNEDSSTNAIKVIFSALTRKQNAHDWIIRFFTVLLPTLFLAAVVFQPWVDPKWMFLDPLTAAELSGDCCHSHFGFVSTAGIILWSATAAIGLFSALVLLLQGFARRIILFPLLSGILTGWIALDDAFLLHETVFPSFGIPQNLTIASYIILAGVYFLVNWRFILKYDFWILALGAGTLALSIVVDVIFHSLNPYLILLEDSAKFFGIFCWVSFHITTFAKLLSEAIPAKPVS